MIKVSENAWKGNVNGTRVESKSSSLEEDTKDWTETIPSTALDLLARVVQVAYDDAAIIDSIAAYRRRGRRRIRKEYEALRALRHNLDALLLQGQLSPLGRLGLEVIKRHKKLRQILSINDYERRSFHNARISLDHVAQLDEEMISDLASDDFDDILLYVELYEKEIKQNDRFQFEFQAIPTVERISHERCHHEPIQKTQYFEQAFKKRTHFKKVRYMTPEQRRKFLVTFNKDGLLVHDSSAQSRNHNHKKEHSYHLVNVADAKYCLTLDKQLYIGHLDALNKRLFASHLRSQYLHPSFMSKGDAVLAAGRITVKDGIVIQFDNASSHFQPHLPSLTRFFSFLHYEAHAQLRFPLVLSYFPPGAVGGKNFGLLSPLQQNEILALDGSHNLVRIIAEKSTKSHKRTHSSSRSAEKQSTPPSPPSLYE